MDLNDLLLLSLSFIGSFVGVNFGGAMLFVMPVLLGFGYSPVVAVSSTRPAILLQSLIGLRMFRKFNRCSARQVGMLFLSSILGALTGFGLLSNLTPEMATTLMIFLLILVAIMAAARQSILKPPKKTHQSEAAENQPLIWYFTTGFLPATIGGLIGVGAGLIVLFFTLTILKRKIQEGTFVEKIVSAGHSTTVLISAFWIQALDLKNNSHHIHSYSGRSLPRCPIYPEHKTNLVVCGGNCSLPIYSA